MKRLPAYTAAVASSVLALNVAFPASAAIVDRDGDRMDDGWEQSVGLEVGTNDAGRDPDGDHLTNYMEYQHRSDPMDRLDPGSHLLLGAMVTPLGSESQQEAIEDFESQIGRSIAVHRHFSGWNEPLASFAVERDIENGRLTFKGWKAEVNGNPIKWASIANGQHDAWIRRQADGLRELGAPILLNFHHEPENDVGPRGSGSAADYRAAWRRIVTIFRQQGATNVRFAFVLMSGSYHERNARKDADRYYPGNQYIDYIGSNYFNGWPAKPGAENRSFREGLQPFYKWGTSKGKPLVIGAFGAQEHPDQPEHRSRWLQEAADTLRGWPAVRLACYFNSDERFPYALDGPGLRTYREFANQPYFGETELW